MTSLGQPHRRWSAIVLSLAAMVCLAGPPATAQAPAPAAAAPRAQLSLDEVIKTRLALFQQQDAAARPAPGGIVFVGSSIFAQWPDVAADMAPMKAYNRAISGTRTTDQLKNIDALALQYQPAIVVFYAGSNDINEGASAADIVSNVRRYSALVRQRLPNSHFVFVSINRAPQKRANWPIAEDANRQIAAMATDPAGRFHYVDVDRQLEDAAGEPLPGLYKPDGLHFFPNVYQRFTAAVRPTLEKLTR